MQRYQKIIVVYKPFFFASFDAFKNECHTLKNYLIFDKISALKKNLFFRACLSVTLLASQHCYNLKRDIFFDMNLYLKLGLHL